MELPCELPNESLYVNTGTSMTVKRPETEWIELNKHVRMSFQEPTRTCDLQSPVPSSSSLGILQKKHPSDELENSDISCVTPSEAMDRTSKLDDLEFPLATAVACAGYVYSKSSIVRISVRSDFELRNNAYLGISAACVASFES